MTTVTPAGRHRRNARLSLASVLVLLVALGAGARLLSLPGQAPPPQPPLPAGPLTLTQAWEGVAPSSVSGLLTDGTQFTPWLYLDGQTALGTADTPDNTATRVLLRTGTDEPAELHRVPTERNPQFNAFTAAGDDVVWVESTGTGDGPGENQLYRANWRGRTPAVALTADTGTILYANNQYDLTIADDRVHWISGTLTPADEPVSQLRSVPLAGGAVTIRDIPGEYALTAWPWLNSIASQQVGQVDLLNSETNETLNVPVNAGELVSCSPVWCRSIVLAAGNGRAVYSLVRTDGSQRQRVTTGNVSAAVQDVALLNRFELLIQAGNANAPASSQRLMMYDLKDSRLIRVADGVATVNARGGVVWWSTGDNEAIRWHALDLRDLP